MVTVRRQPATFSSPRGAILKAAVVVLLLLKYSMYSAVTDNFMRKFPQPEKQCLDTVSPTVAKATCLRLSHSPASNADCAFAVTNHLV